MVTSITLLKICTMYLSKINMILLGIFSEVIAYNMHQNIKQLHNNISACELYLVMPEFMKDICLTDVNVYITSYGT